MAADGPPPDDGSPTVDELRAALELAEAKVEEYRNDLLRARADLENERKRSGREMQDARRFALQEFIEDLLPVKDSLERGLEAASTASAHGTEALREGTVLTLKLCNKVFAAAGVDVIDPVGEQFDPEVHEAIAVERSIGAAPNTVISVHQKGYLLNGRLVRPARVVVSATE